MAGSYRKIVDGQNNFVGTANLSTMDDANAALNEAYWMIRWLTGNDKREIHRAWMEGYVKNNTQPPRWNAVAGATDFWKKDDLTP